MISKEILAYLQPADGREELSVGSIVSAHYFSNSVGVITEIDNWGAKVFWSVPPTTYIMKIDSSGSVGIGTRTPGIALKINSK